MKMFPKTRRESNRKLKQFNPLMKRKLALTYIIVALLLFALALQIFRIMRKNGSSYQRIILSQQGYQSTTLASRRGDIMDRNYTVLATSEEVYNLILDPKVITYTLTESNPSPNFTCTVNALAECFGYDKETLRGLLTENKESSYIRYQMNLSREDRDRFLDYQTQYNTAKNDDGSRTHKDKVTGVWFEAEYKRYYPYDNLACTALGFSLGDSSQGNWGIEQYYNDTLVGTDGKQYSYMNTDGNYEQVTKDPINGYTVVSTIDYTIQKIVEDRIAAFKAENQYKNIGVVVMDPTTAEILAMGTSSSYNLNAPDDLTTIYTQEQLDAMSDEEKLTARNQMWRNFTINDTYLPGSVFKPLMVAMALEENVISVNDKFLCTGAEAVSGRRITCNKLEGHGELTLQQAIMFSCNSAMMQIVSKLDADTFYKYKTSYGFGTQSGVDLPGEAAGILRSASELTPVDLAVGSFGQGFQVNMIQMAAAYCALLNDGTYYKPHIVKQILDSDGSLVKNVEPELVRQTVTAETSDFIRKALFAAVEGGYGKVAKIEGYAVGGKTGTSQKYPLEDKKYVTSYMSCVPIDNPELLVYVVIDEPETVNGNASSKGAISLEQQIMSSIVEYMGIPVITPEEEKLKEELLNTTEIGEEEQSQEPETMPEIGNEDEAQPAQN